MKRYMNIIKTALPAPYHCTSCGSILHWVEDCESGVSRWECGCGEFFQIIEYTENELEDFALRNDHESLTRSEFKLACDSYIKAVLEVFGIGFGQILERKRSRECVMAREIIAYYLYTARGNSITRVGEMLGGRASATAYHLIKLYEYDVRHDKNFKKYLNEIERILGQ